MNRKKIHVMSNTHWDREHRHAFQETRIMLVQLIDELIEIMEADPEYRFFTFDGQSIILDDYLEVKPHMRERLTRLITEGRILIGPWYSLVDCFSVNPESIIRNLLVGHKTCKQFGEPMKLGYSIFSFGQMAQLPQVYGGFGISDIVFYKNPSKEVLPQSEFIWIAPDGTEAFASRLGRDARWNFFSNFSVPVILGGNMKKPGWQSKFGSPVRLTHMTDEQFNRYFSIELEPDIRIREEYIQKAVDDVLCSVEESASQNVFLAFEGTDFTSPLKDIPQALKIANELMKDNVELVYSNPVQYFKEVKQDIAMNSLVRYQGEMRFGPISHVHCETMGVNVEIKQAMFHAENMLIHYAEPLSTFLNVNGGKYEKDILDLAWKYLLSAQAHDSIHGAGDPKIKKDTLSRLEQVQEIAESITRRAVEGLSALIDMSAYNEGDILIAVFNTTPYPRSEVMRMTIDLPAEELVKDYWIEDLNGQRVETYQLKKYKFNLAMVHRAYRPKTVYCDRVEIDAYINEVPAMGIKLFKLKRIQGDPNCYQHPMPSGIFPYNPIAKSGNILDNGLIKVTINQNGTVDVYDYDSGNTFKGLNYFTDTGCCGDFWVHREPMENQTISSKGACAKISLIKNSSLSATYRVTVMIEIPEQLADGKTDRSKNAVTMEIISDITVNKGSKRIDFKTTLDNRAKDHMLVVSFPTGINSEYAYSECPFEIRRRDVDNFTDHFGIKGVELERHTMQNFVDISDHKQGFSLFTKGLKEFGLTKNDCPVINLTLLRAVSGTFPIHDDLFVSFENETSQCIGNHVFEYSVLIHGGGIREGDVIQESRKYITPLLSAEIGNGKGGVLRGDISFMKMKGSTLTICAVKLSEDGSGIVVRLNNPTDIQVEDEITFMNEICEAYIANMNEELKERLDVGKYSVPLTVEPYKILTLYLKFKF